MTDTRKPHPFKQGPADLTACIEGLHRDRAGISCGRPAADPIHTVSPAVLQLLEQLRGATMDHAMANYRQGRANGMGTISDMQDADRDVLEAFTRRLRLFRELGEMLAAHTPAETRTGISDRAAAALEDVSELRYGLLAGPVDWTPYLDRIERALRGDR